MGQLILSLFPGIGLLDMAFEQEGFCVVRGPDLLWGGDVKRFHPPGHKFDGVIGGPPCQSHSRFRHLAEATGKNIAPDLIPEFERCVAEARPSWFLMENVSDSPEPVVEGYKVFRFILQNRHLGEIQNRERAFSFGRTGARLDLRRYIQLAPLENAEWCGAILASGGRRPGTESRRGKTRGAWHGFYGPREFAHALKAQGLPEDFLADSPFKMKERFRVVGNGVPLPMGRAVAKAVAETFAEAERVAKPALEDFIGGVKLNPDEALEGARKGAKS